MTEHACPFLKRQLLWDYDHSQYLTSDGICGLCNHPKYGCSKDVTSGQMAFNESGTVYYKHNEEYDQFILHLYSCKYIHRLLKTIENAKKTRPYGQKTPVIDRNFVVFAFHKLQPYNNPPEELLVLSWAVRRFAAKFLVEKCRADKDCPYKALLPEYDVT